MVVAKWLSFAAEERRNGAEKLSSLSSAAKDLSPSAATLSPFLCCEGFIAFPLLRRIYRLLLSFMGAVLTVGSKAEEGLSSP